MAGLQPPPIETQNITQTAHDTSDASDDHYSSASEGTHSPIIPTTRVERVDDEAAHGEVPNTPAYNLRLQDAVPDEIEIIPEGRRSRASTNASQRSRGRGLSSASAEGSGREERSRTRTPGGTPIPKTVVEKVDFKPSYGEVEGTPAKEMRMADAIPDEIRKAPELGSDEGVDDGEEDDEDEEGDNEDEDDPDDRRQEWFRSMWEGGDARQATSTAAGNVEMQDDNDDDDNDDNDDDFGDDFDEFAEGGEDEDFGDFDDRANPQPPPSTQPTAPDILSDLPSLDLSSCTTAAEIQEAILPYITLILPNNTPPQHPKPSLPPLDPSQTPAFQSDRSLSLWQQLVSPPPMQPPNWTKSRIRRLFLVSLGVPVDLDEILPPSKQKRLILPSAGLDESGNTNNTSNFPRPSTSAIDRLRDNDSTTSLDSQNKPKRKTGARPGASAAAAGSRTTAPAPPDLDLNACSLLCSTTPEALSLYTDVELAGHVRVLTGLNQKASLVLEFWLQRKDEALKEKEALEGVIENLVGFVKGRRGR